jgi:hypothetical protein
MPSPLAREDGRKRPCAGRGRNYLKREAIAQIAPLGQDAPDDGALAVVGDEIADEVDLVHGHELEDFLADVPARPPRQLVGDLQMLGRFRTVGLPEVITQLALGQTMGGLLLRSGRIFFRKTGVHLSGKCS